MRRASALLLAALAAAATAAPAPAEAAASVFTRVEAATVRPDADGPRRFAAFAVDRRALRTAARPGATIALPAPDGELQRFVLRDAPVMEPGLAREHPEIRTFAGRGVEDRTATVRLSVTPLGLHASVRGAGRQWYVEPPRAGQADRVVSFVRDALPATARPPRLQDPLHADHADHAAPRAAGAPAGEPVALRTYRLALVSDPAYSRTSGAAAGLDPAAPGFLEELRDRTTAAKAVLMTRVNQLYESDFAIRMLLVDATDRLNLVTDAEATGADGPCGRTPCFTAANLGGCSSGLLARNQAVTGLIAGARAFDIGHIALGKDGGGIAGLGVVGKARKAAGCTGLAKPFGDVFAVDYVAHEMGHQFGGDHTFNGRNGACLATNRNLSGAAAVEPGSGTTVQAYAGICASDNLQSNSDPVFSQFSIEQMGAYVRTPPEALSSTQLVVLRSAPEGFALTYRGRRTPVLPAGAPAADVDAAIEALLPEGGTTTVAATADGYSVAFGGALAGEAVDLLGVRGADGFVGEPVAGGPTTQGGDVRRTRNTAPVVTAPAAFTIPKQTPFALTAQGTDADRDPLTFLWEQDDAAPPALGGALVDPVKATGPLFRVFGTAARYASPDDAYLSPSPGQNVPGADPTRAFPDTRQVALDNTNALTGLCPPAVPDPVGFTAPTPEQVDCFSEFLPTASWAGLDATSTMHFRVTARDGFPGAGGTAFADTAVRVDKATGPFRVLPALPVDSGLTARWMAAGTEATTPQVRISLSTDGGRTFPLVLAEATPNDGSQVLTVPAGVRTTEGRLKVEAVGNVFFDVSHQDLRIG